MSDIKEDAAMDPGRNFADAETVIRISHLTKIYRLYDKPSDRLKEALGFSKKKRYTELRALDDVSFDVHRGETVGIIGTNGSGKSTILKIITGVLTQTSGEVQVNGRISALLELGAGFNMEYTGIENIYLNGTMMGFSREEIDARMDSILKFADIGDFVYQPCKTYSSGMFVRLAFAVAINIDPEILIVDEALSVGDVFFQAKCYHKFDEFKEQGKTILIVSHDLSSISKYCDRVILLNKGVKRAEGAPNEMVDLYKKLLVHIDEDPNPATGAENPPAEPEEVKETSPEPAEEKKPESPEADMPGQTEESSKQAPPAAEPVYNTLTGPLPQNPDTNEYGEGQAKIISVRIVDASGQVTNTIEKGAFFTIVMRIRAAAEIESPIAAYTIKNLMGIDITGTNTMFEHDDIPPMKPGDEAEISFRQKMNLQGGEYLISFGCTGYHEGDFRVFHRLYDLLNLTVISTKNTVGFYDMDAEVKVRMIENGAAG